MMYAANNMFVFIILFCLFSLGMILAIYWSR
jgi:hypothetical protein